MAFTDIFIRRPVLTLVVSLLIVVLGLRAFLILPVQEFPRTINATITISTTYYGADPDVVAGFITAPLENAIAQADGIDYLTSTSRNGTSTINATLRLNYDPNKALSEINTKVRSVLNQLPPSTQQPVLRIQAQPGSGAIYVGFYSETMPINQITDYVTRIVQPRLQQLNGVQNAGMVGSRNLALRAWLDPTKLAGYGMTADEVSKALASNNFLSGLGNTKGQMVQMNLNASTDVHSLDGFKDIVIKQAGGATVRLRDVADVSIGGEDYESSVVLDGQAGLWINVEITPAANMLDVVSSVRQEMPEIEAQLPPGLHAKVMLDNSRFVRAAIREVVKTLIEALVIVTLVVFAFLGSVRSAVVPIVAIPLSLVGTFAVMLIFGFSINLLTLLAFVLAIGLVVDDAIIIVENVNRHVAEGTPPIPAALQAARELGGPIIAMAAVLIAVYVPIGFQGGLTGALFTEFAFTLVGAVAVSTIVALTLSPMMSSRLLTPHSGDDWQARAILFIDKKMEALSSQYRRALHDSLNYVAVTLVFAVIVLSSIYTLYTGARGELAPQEDRGAVTSQVAFAPTAAIQQRMMFQKVIYEKLHQHDVGEHIWMNINMNSSLAAITMKDWDKRATSSTDLQRAMQRDFSEISGLRAAVFQQAPLPGGGIGPPIQFILSSTESFDRMNRVADNFVQEAMKSGLFASLDQDLKIDQPRATLMIDRAKAAELGMNMSDVGSSLSAMLGGGYVNYFALEGRSYKVIPQVEQRYRLNPNQLLDYYVHTPNGGSIPLSTLAHIETRSMPQSFNHFQQLNAVTVTGVAAPGVTMGDSLKYLQNLAATTLPIGYTTDFSGQSRQFMQESSGFALMFLTALLIIFLVLAALFESFRDPLIILVSVPMSIAGALLFINLGVGGATINIYTQVGLVTLMGLISKHGILIVRFANQLQAEGHSKREAAELAAEIRLRPILMTTAAMVLGVAPLLTAHGAGAASRFNMGLVIASGISIGTLFTLFVVPAVYVLLAADHSQKAAPQEDIPGALAGQGAE